MLRNFCFVAVLKSNFVCVSEANTFEVHNGKVCLLFPLFAVTTFPSICFSCKNQFTNYVHLDTLCTKKDPQSSCNETSSLCVPPSFKQNHNIFTKSLCLIIPAPLFFISTFFLDFPQDKLSAFLELVFKYLHFSF